MEGKNIELRKVIIIECCDGCPFNGKCKPWKKLSSNQRMQLSLGVGIGKFILNGCPLPDGEDGSEPFDITIIN